MYDLTGKSFGRLTVLTKTKSKCKQITWLCRCDCGKEIPVLSWNLRSGHTISCGCKCSENLKNGLRTSHKLINHRLYGIWENMKSRCYNPNTPQFQYYGQQGIVICDEWKHEFLSFYNWAIKNGYSDELSIDRINPYGNYEPSNCRWATSEEQNNNKRK